MVLTRIAVLAAVLLTAMTAAAQPTPTAITANLTTTTCTGNPGSGTGCLVLNIASYGAAGIQLAGTWTGTVSFSTSLDGTNYSATSFIRASSSAAVSTSTSNGAFSAAVGGFKYVKVAFTTATSGTVAVTLLGALSGGANASSSGGGGAMTVADGADVALGTTTDPKNTATDGTSVTAIALLKEISAMEQAPASRAVTGTFWQATQPVSGTFWQATQPVSGTITTTPPANASTNVTQWNGTTVIQGDANNIASAAGALNTAPIARYNATQPTLTDGRWNLFQVSSRGGLFVATGADTFNVTVNAALPAGANVIGHVIADGGSTTAVTGNVTVVQPTGTNLHAVLDTTSTTAVTQATATNLKAQVVGAGTAGTADANPVTIQGIAGMTKVLVTPDSVALPANQSVNVAQVAGTNTVTGGVAGIIAVGGNVANAVTATANPIPVGGIFTTTPATLTTGQTATNQYTAAQNLKHDITTIAGTAPTTAGKVDVKGADGDVFVRQATAANLNAAVVGTGTAGAPAGNILTVQGVASMTKLLVTPDSVALPANQSVNLAQVAGGTTINAGTTGSLAVGGCVATNTATPCNPMNLGAQAVSSENSAATTAREVQLVADLVGKLIVLPYANPENEVHGTTAAITDTTSTSVIASAGGSLKNYITDCVATNSGTVGTFVKILEGTNIIDEFYAQSSGGGAARIYLTPRRSAAATAINAQMVTTGANVIVSCGGYKGL